MSSQGPSRSQIVAGVFDRVAQTYDNVGVPWFTPIAATLVQELAPVAGERALDVGSGRGAALFPLAQAVGPTGSVHGIDLAPGMVSALRADVEARGLTGVRVEVMDAATPQLPPSSFDVVASSLVLFFLADPAPALAAWSELLVPGGRLGISTFGPRDEHWVALDEVFTPYLPQRMLDARTSGVSGPFGSDAGVEGLFHDAGLREVRTLTVEVPVVFADADQWHTWSWSHGQRQMWEAVPEDRRDDVRAAAEQRLAATRLPDGGYRLGQQVRYTFGRR